MRAKTLITTLVSFHTFPPREDDLGGDLLPEAAVVKNVVEGLHSGADALIRVRRFLSRCQSDVNVDEAVDIPDNCNEEWPEQVLKLRSALKKLRVKFLDFEEAIEIERANLPPISSTIK